MNSRPITRRLASGSSIFASFERNRADASTRLTRNRMVRLNVSMTLSDSPLRRRPLSTKMQVSRLPIASCTRLAAAVESTPPLSAQIPPSPPSPSPPAAQRADRPFARESLPQRRHRLLPERPHRPRRGAAADALNELLQHRPPLRRVRDLGMELEGVDPPAMIRHRRDRRVGGVADRVKSGRHRFDPIAVAHPDATREDPRIRALWADPAKQPPP